jgi:hypothetical protein
MAERDRTAAERQRRQRRREAKGLRPYRIDLPEALVVDTMIDVGEVTVAEARDQKLIERALEIFVHKQILRHGVTVPGESGSGTVTADNEARGSHVRRGR